MVFCSLFGLAIRSKRAHQVMAAFSWKLWGCMCSRWAYSIVQQGRLGEQAANSVVSVGRVLVEGVG